MSQLQNTIEQAWEGRADLSPRAVPPAVRAASTEEGKRVAMMKALEDMYKRAIADTETYSSVATSSWPQT